MSVHKCELDHIVIVAPALGTGAQYVRRLLGVEPQPGGSHVGMGTHNLLLRLGPTCYLEIIAVDASAPAPGRPRWFGMDAWSEDTAPRLVTWVARTNDLTAALAGCPRPMGDVLPMTRGSLSWQITVPPDGRLLDGGTVPTLIQWGGSAHPAGELRDMGVTLKELMLFHPDPDTVTALLQRLKFDGPVSIRRSAAGMGPGIGARMDTPAGERLLGQSAG